jgi:hypothetical protein
VAPAPTGEPGPPARPEVPADPHGPWDTAARHYLGRL